jgi:hypothetical protein
MDLKLQSPDFRLSHQVGKISLSFRGRGFAAQQIEAEFEIKNSRLQIRAAPLTRILKLQI